MKPSTQLLLAASALPSALAWGDLGHETIAYIASNFGKCLHPIAFVNLLAMLQLGSHTPY
jgi:hypothetical protein